MGYRIEMLVSKRGRCKVWRQVHGRKALTRNEAITEASKIVRPGRIRIRKIQPRKPGGATPS